MVDTNVMTPIEALVGGDQADPLSLGNLAAAAKTFLMSHEWCRGIKRGYVGMAYEGIVGVFYFSIERGCADADPALWVVSGDLPPAYLVCDECPDASSALRRYVTEMRHWVSAVRDGRSVEDVIPVNAPETREYADMLQSRLDFLEREILATEDAPPETGK